MRRGDGEGEVGPGADTGPSIEARDHAYVSFRLGAHRFAIDARRCVRVVVAARPTPFPLPVRGLPGMINVKGRVATVVDPSILREDDEATNTPHRPTANESPAVDADPPEPEDAERRGSVRPSLLTRIRETKGAARAHVEAEVAEHDADPGGKGVAQERPSDHRTIEGRYVIVVEDAGTLIGLMVDEVERVLRWPHVSIHALEDAPVPPPAGLNGLVSARLAVVQHVDAPSDEVSDTTRRNLASIMAAVEQTFGVGVAGRGPGSDDRRAVPGAAEAADPSGADDVSRSGAADAWLLDVSRLVERVGERTGLVRGRTGGAR